MQFGRALYGENIMSFAVESATECAVTCALHFDAFCRSSDMSNTQCQLSDKVESDPGIDVVNYGSWDYIELQSQGIVLDIR